MWKRLTLLWVLVKGDVRRVWRAWRHPACPNWFKFGTLGVAVYLFSPVDLLPDFIPLLGIVDDLVLVPAALHWLLSRLPASVLRDIDAPPLIRPVG
jgi:uncharacterized membrane protein YkvA (DUF1232 family)